MHAGRPGSTCVRCGEDARWRTHGQTAVIQGLRLRPPPPVTKMTGAINALNKSLLSPPPTAPTETNHSLSLPISLPRYHSNPLFIAIRKEIVFYL